MKAYLSLFVVLLLSASPVNGEPVLSCPNSKDLSNVRSGDPKLEAQIQYEIGCNQHDKHNYTSAINAFTEAIKLNPHHALAWGDRAYDRYRVGDIRGGIEDLTELIRFCPEGRSAAFCGRGLMQSDLGEEESAISDFSQAINLRSDRSLYFKSRGKEYIRVGNYLAAIKDFTEAIKLDPRELEPCSTYLSYRLSLECSPAILLRSVDANFSKNSTLHDLLKSLPIRTNKYTDTSSGGTR